MARRLSQRSRRKSSSQNRATTGWRKFFIEKREEVQKQNPNMNSREIMKKLGEMWRQRDDETRNQYENQNQKKQYQKNQSKSGEKSLETKEDKNKKGQSSSQKYSRQQSNKENQNDELSE